MPDLEDGESIEVQGSAKAPYVIRNVGGVYSCTCPAWRNQSVGIERRTCKHIRALRGDAAEEARIGSAVSPAPKSGEGESQEGPPLLLAHRWENDVDLAGWWMSEKLDGVRAWWDGSKFISRLGNEFFAPDWFVEGLPETPLDGELWLDRKAFQRTVSIVRRQDRSEHWKELTYVVFDAPQMEEPFEERIAHLEDFIRRRKPAFAKAHAHERCRNLEHLREELTRIETLGGEGLMLRRPGSRYEAGRSTTLLKVKTFHDAEARVIDYVDGKGRHKGRVGSLVVETPEGVRFSVGTGLSDAMRASPPPLGASITYRFQELSDGGVPRFPSFVGVRSDVSQSEESPRARKPKTMPKSAAAPSAKPAAAKPAAAKPAGAKPPAAATSIGTRRFEFVEGKSSKFWEISVADADVTVRFGRIGTEGQTKTKSFADIAAATRHAEKLIEEKTGKGYVEM
jgi:DNA ligase-1